MKKIIYFWNQLRSTFWFVPVLIIIASITLSIVLLHLDQFIELSQQGLSKFFFIGSADSARSVLSIISAAMIGVAGTVFSVTLVALTLASSQFGSRLIKNFMYVRLNQVVLGTYISTYVYCLIVLNTIKENNNFTFIPSLSILVALVAAVVNIILLIVFIHRIAISIQADHVISAISKSIAKDVQVLFPEKMGEENDDEKRWNVKKEKSKYKNDITIYSQHSGYLQYIDSEALIRIMVESESLLELSSRPGDYLVLGEELGSLYTNQGEIKDITKKIHAQFIIGRSRNSQQDIEFSIHQMVEIASRALSPGINDPYTAITCIDNLTSTMSYLTQIRFPEKYRCDNEGILRVIAETFDYEGILDVSFNQIRQFSSNSPAVIIRLMEALNKINKFAKKPLHKKAIIKHAKMVLNQGRESIKEKLDLNDLIEKSNLILKQQKN